MKTSKARVISEPKKTSKTDEAGKSGPAKTRKSKPGDEEIRKKAMEIYYERIARGEHGTAESDWLEAEKLLSGS